MNYFFFASSDDYNCRLAIPKFRADGGMNRDNQLIRARITNGNWDFKIVADNEGNESFWHVEEKSFQKDDIFFIATKNDFLRQKQENILLELNRFTHTDPAFRCNLEISNRHGGWSSYQSEYPYRMIGRRGTVFSNVGALSNPEAELNGCFLRNIFCEPIVQPFRVLVFDASSHRVLLETQATTNTTSYISFDDLSAEQGQLVLWVEGFLGIPIYVSTDQLHNISMEHTHPPHESVHGAERFALVAKLKAQYDKQYSS